MPTSDRARTRRASGDVHHVRPSPHRTNALTAAFAASGAAGLIFEMVWFHRASLVLGNSLWAASIVLASFMAGLGLGNFLAGWQSSRIHSPLRTYALLELVVAVSGIAATYALPELSGLVVHVSRFAQSSPSLLAVARLAIAFGILVLPATAMGATLPVLIAAVARSEEGLGYAFGRLYGWNTVGAVGGVVCTELVLVERVGIAGAAWTAVALNASAAGISLWILSRSSAKAVSIGPPANIQTSVPPTAWRLLACASLSGFALMALEVVWFRFLSMFVLTTTLPMSLMLAVVLAGIGAGGLVASGLLRRQPSWFTVSGVAFMAAVAVPGSYRLFGVLTTGSQIGDWRQVLWLALVLTGPCSFLSGVLLTVLAESVGHETAGRTQATAWLLLANTVGATCGQLLAAFWVLPTLGMERALFALAATYVAVGALTLSRSDLRGLATRTWISRLAGAAAVITLAAFPFGLMGRYYDRAVGPYKADGSEIIASREGSTESILLMRLRWLNQPVYDRLVTNGFSMSGTAAPARRYMRYFAYWPMMLHASPLRRALLICYGVGVTASALTDIPSLETLDVVETSANIVGVSDLIYSPAQHPLHDPRVRLHLEDGRYFLQTAGGRYDLITGEPPPPRTPGAVNIYTREYFQLIYNDLAEGGIATYWLPVARPDPGTDVNTIIRAFCGVFADCSLWNATPSDFMLAGTRHAAGPVAEANFTSRWRTAGLQVKLREIGFEVPEEIGATFLGDAVYLRNFVAATPPLTDGFPQRLRPAVNRFSLSDPRYNAEPAAMRQYQTILDPARARDEFARSDWIHRLWPPDLAERTLPFFEYQRIVNRVYLEGGQPLRQIADLHALLTKTSLETLPLWLLGSNDVIQRIAQSAEDAGPTVEYIRALDALARRKYGQAVSGFERAEALKVQTPMVRPLLVYALCLDGRVDAARDRALGIRPATPDERDFWRWMGSEFMVGPFAREQSR